MPIVVRINEELQEQYFDCERVNFHGNRKQGSLYIPDSTVHSSSNM